VRIPTHREPTHPGELLLEEFLIPMEISPDELAIAIRMPSEVINDILTQKTALTPSIALRLARFLGMSEDFWMSLQLRRDLYQTQKSEQVELQLIKPFSLQKTIPTFSTQPLAL
jgi:addiction module HigA family antidote